MSNGQPLCEPENLWKGADPTRGRFERPQPETGRPKNDDAELEYEDLAEILEINELARKRIRRLR